MEIRLFRSAKWKGLSFHQKNKFLLDGSVTAESSMNYNKVKRSNTVLHYVLAAVL